MDHHFSSFILDSIHIDLMKFLNDCPNPFHHRRIQSIPIGSSMPILSTTNLHQPEKQHPISPEARWKMKSLTLTSILCLSILLSACSYSSDSQKDISSTPDENLSNTLSLKETETPSNKIQESSQPSTVPPRQTESIGETAFLSTPEQVFGVEPPLIILESSSGFYLFTEDGDQIGKIDVRNLEPSGYYLERTISPSGGWIAWRNFQNSEDIATLTLNVAQLSDADHPRRIPLMAQEKTTNIQIRENSRNAIITGVSMRWSPNGRLLAFVAELETAIANLYVFDTQTGNINRLTDSSKTLMILSWTPDGNSILYEEVESCGGMGCRVIAGWVAPIDGSEPRILYGETMSVGDQLVGFPSKDQVLMVSSNLAGPIQLSKLTITTGESLLVFSAPFSSAAIDPNSGTMVITAPIKTEKGATPAKGTNLSLIHQSGQQTIWIQTGNWAETDWLPEANRFLIIGSSSEPALLMTPDGKITEFPTETGLGELRTRVSPDGTKLTFYNDTGLRIYTLQAALIDKVMIGPVQSFVWNSDSTGGSFISEGILYKVDTTHPNQTAQIVLKINDLNFNSQLVLIRGNDQ